MWFFFPEDRPAKPIGVKLRRINANLAQAYPPKGDERLWWARLKVALGTSSSDFVNASLYQLQAAASLPGAGICEIAMNAALAFVESLRPQNELEAALAIQMACTHSANMTILSRLRGGGDRHVAATSSASARLVQAFATQAETLRRLKIGNLQTVRVEHVHVHGGVKAAIENITSLKIDGTVRPDENSGSMSK